jgi:glycosyltransferase involved in cell wall biosynthesis
MELIYGSALWFTSTKVNCHHLAERLAEETPVVFVESVGARQPRAHEWRRLLPRLLRSFRPLRRVAPRVWVYSPLPLPLYRGDGATTNSRWVGWQVRALMALRRWKVDVCWLFHPMGLGTAERVQARGTIYYCVDDHAANPGVDPAAVRELERAVLRRADLTVTTGEPLARRLRAEGGRVEVVPNVADTELFSRDATADQHPVLAAIDALPRPRLGYLGNLAAYKIDLGLVREIAQLRPDWAFVLVGPTNQGDVREAVDAAQLPSNVHLMGPVPHELAPAVMDRFDVALLPSAQHEVMQSSFPLKFFEYLLRGKPVVARPIPMLAPFTEWFDSADTAPEFVQAIERNLAEDTAEAAGRRRRFAAALGWDGKMAQLQTLRAQVLVAQRAGP